MQHVVEAVEVGAQYRVPVVVAERGEGAVACQSGVEDDAVTGAVRGDVRFQHFADVVTVADVKLQHARRAAVGADVCRGFFRLGKAAATMDDDGKAVGSEALCDGTANATASTSNQYGFRVIHAVLRRLLPAAYKR